MTNVAIVGDGVLPLIAERELRRRHPSISISLFATHEWEGVPRDAFDLVVERVSDDAFALAADLFPRDTLERRVRQLGAVGLYPAHTAPIVVDREIPIESRALDVVRLGDDWAVEDLVAAIAHARAVAGSSAALIGIAAAFGIPAIGSAASASRDRASEEFDRLAGEAERAAAQRAGRDPAEAQRAEIALLTVRYDALRRAHQALRERAAAERALLAEAVNRFAEGELNDASLLYERTYFQREWWDARHACTRAEQRAAAAEEKARAVEARFEALAGENVSLRDQLQRATLDLVAVQQVLRTKLVSNAQRVQGWLARLRGK